MWEYLASFPCAAPKSEWEKAGIDPVAKSILSRARKRKGPGKVPKSKPADVKPISGVYFPQEQPKKKISYQAYKIDDQGDDPRHKRDDPRHKTPVYDPRDPFAPFDPENMFRPFSQFSSVMKQNDLSKNGSKGAHIP